MQGRLGSALAFVLPLLLYLALPARVLNGDGLAYWTMVQSGGGWHDWLPGHLLYLPLMAALNQAGQWLAPASSTETVLRLVNQLAGAASVWLVFCTAGRLGCNRFGQWLAAGTMAVSYGVWIQAIDIETYALAVAGVTASMYAMTRCGAAPGYRWTVVLGVCNSLAALFHLATITLGLASVLLLIASHRATPGRLARHLAVYFAVAALVFGLPVCAIGFWHLQLPSFLAVLSWLKSSEHGYRVVFDALSPPRAAYGLARNFLVLESFWTAPWWVTAVKGLALLSAAGWLAWQRCRQPARLTPTARLVLGSMVAFVLCQALLGVYFFGSDSERWVFLTPFFALLLAAYACCWPFRQRCLAAAGVVLLAGLNLTQGIWPLATDQQVELRVQGLAGIMTDNTLIISTGNDWTSYYAYYTKRQPERISLIGLALRHRDDHEAFYAELADRLEQARRDGRLILAVRVLDEADNLRETPWPELAALGLRPQPLRAWFGQYAWEERRLSDPAGTPVHQLISRDYALASNGETP